MARKRPRSSDLNFAHVDAIISSPLGVPNACLAKDKVCTKKVVQARMFQKKYFRHFFRNALKARSLPTWTHLSWNTNEMRVFDVR